MTTTARKRATIDDPIAAAGADDDAMTAENETLAPPEDGGEVDAPMIVIAADDVEAADDDEEDPAEELAPRVQTTVRVPVRKGARVTRRVIRLVHEAGCPAHVARVESYALPNAKGRAFIITRCVDCAAQIKTKA